MTAFKDIRKILIIKLRHIGDVLLTVPAIRAVRETFPSAYIAALVNKGTEEMLTGNPLLNEVIAYDSDIKELPLHIRVLREVNFVRSLRNMGFDMTVDLTSGDRAAIISLISGARYRLAYDPCGAGFLGKRFLYTHLAQKNESQHMALQNLDVVKQFGISTGDLKVDFYIPDEARLFVRRIFEENDIKADDTVVHVHPASRWLFKCWKDEYMAEVIKRLTKQGIRVILTSSPDKREMEKAKRILSFCPSPENQQSRVIDLCGKISIKQLAAVSEISDLFFGVDSAPMHISAAIGKPVMAIFGPSGAFNWGPWDNNQESGVRGRKSELKTEDKEYTMESAVKAVPYPKRHGIQTSGIHTVIQRDWECVPCGRDGCNGSKISRCLEDIKPEEVVNLLEKYLRTSWVNA